MRWSWRCGNSYMDGGMGEKKGVSVLCSVEDFVLMRA